MIKSLYQRGRIWHARLRLEPTDKLLDFSTRRTDKQSAQSVLDAKAKEVQQERAGFIAPKSQRDASNVLLSEQVTSFINIQRSKRRDAKYLSIVEKHLLRVIEKCHWALPRDVTAESFEIWRANQTLSAKTLNEYLTSASTFFKWMLKTGRITFHPLLSVERLSTKNVDKKQRRSLTQEEFSKLLSVSGDRGVVYMMAAYTGLRRNELCQLEWRDVYLDAEPPYIEARASTTKNGKVGRLFLSDELAAELRKLKPESIEAGKLVFHRMVPRIELFRKHLALAEIPYEDERGKFADFHALRVTFITRMVQSGAQPMVVKAAARHADFRQTMGYMDTATFPVAEAMRALPPARLSQILSHNLVPDCPNVSEDDQEEAQPLALQAALNEEIAPDCPTLSKFVQAAVMVRGAGFEPATPAV